MEHTITWNYRMLLNTITVINDKIPQLRTKCKHCGEYLKYQIIKVVVEARNSFCGQLQLDVKTAPRTLERKKCVVKLYMKQNKNVYSV